MLNYLFPYSVKVEGLTHYFARYYFYIASQTRLKNNLRNIDNSVPALSDNIIKRLLYGNGLFHDDKNQSILM